MSDEVIETLVQKLPVLPPSEEWDSYIDTLPEVRGVPTLKRAIHSYLRNRTLMEKALLTVIATHNRINGIRSKSQRKGDSMKSAKFAARSFFNKLTTDGLRRQCSLYCVDYNAYATQEDIIDKLVEVSTGV